MPSFDIVSQVNLQDLDDAVNNTHKQIGTRYDLRGGPADITLDKKTKLITLTAGDTMALEALKQMLLSNAAKRGVSLKSLHFGEPESAAGLTLRQRVTVKEGLEKDEAKKVVGVVKDLGLKVQPAIQGDEVRVTGKKIDDLQECIAALKGADFSFALQFINMKA